MTKQCPKCGRLSASDSAYCRFCGESLSAAPLVPDDGSVNVSIWTYVWMTILFSLPMVGLIVSVVMAFAPQKNQSLTNFARAYMIIQIVMTVIIVFALLIGFLIIAPLVGSLAEWLMGLVSSI